MLLCTGCAKLVVVAVTFQDRRGGASVCEDCFARAWELIEGHTGVEEDGGGLTEVS
jgi:hypothetical protein